MGKGLEPDNHHIWGTSNAPHLCSLQQGCWECCQQRALGQLMVTSERDFSISRSHLLSKVAHIQRLIHDYKGPAPLPQIKTMLKGHPSSREPREGGWGLCWDVSQPTSHCVLSGFCPLHSPRWGSQGDNLKNNHKVWFKGTQSVTASARVVSRKKAKMGVWSWITHLADSTQHRWEHKVTVQEQSGMVHCKGNALASTLQLVREIYGEMALIRPAELWVLPNHIDTSGNYAKNWEKLINN